MKEFWITVSGEGKHVYLGHANENVNVKAVEQELRECYHPYQLDDEVFEDFYDHFYYLNSIKVLVNIGSKEVDITLSMGECIRTNTLTRDTYRDSDNYYNIAVVFGYGYCIGKFCLKLEDNEEFTPQKLQMYLCKNELHFIPNAISGDYMEYDGKRISLEYDPEWKYYDFPNEVHSIDYAFPYVRSLNNN